MFYTYVFNTFLILMCTSATNRINFLVKWHIKSQASLNYILRIEITNKLPTKKTKFNHCSHASFSAMYIQCVWHLFIRNGSYKLTINYNDGTFWNSIIIHVVYYLTIIYTRTFQAQELCGFLCSHTIWILLLHVDGL